MDNRSAALLLLMIAYPIVGWGMFQAGKWMGDRDAWREADADAIKLACVEVDLEEMTTQRDQLAGYVDQLEDRLAPQRSSAGEEE